MSIVKKITGLSKTQLETLFKTGKLETSDGILTFGDSDIYLVPDEENTICNPNLLINGDFRVNQRGFTNYDHAPANSGGYTIDRWWMAVGATTIVNNDGSITIQNTSGVPNRHLIQFFEDYTKLLGKTFTFSMKVKNAIAGDKWKVAFYDGENLFGETEGSYENNGENIISATITMANAITTGRKKLGLIVYTRQTATLNDTITIEYVKLEIGSIATPYSPRPYAEELAMCQRYCVVINQQNYTYVDYGLGQASRTDRVDIKTNTATALRTPPTMKYILNNGNITEYIPANLSLLSSSSGSVVIIKPVTDIVYGRQHGGESVLRVTAGNIVVGGVYSLYVDSGDKVKIIYDAEIY